MKLLRPIFAASCLAPVVSAQNEVVLVGTSVGGSTDPHYFASSASGALVWSGGYAFTDNVTDAVWMDLGPFPLPLDLGSFGMPGCSLLAEAALTTLLLGGTTATWQLAIPNDPTYLGFTFYNQGFALDPPANALGLTVSNGARAVIGT